MEKFIETHIDSDRMHNSKIKINCGSCGRLKCEIKKTFRDTARQFTSNFSAEFKLNCPFYIPKYQTGQMVKFTIACGAYEKTTEWECTMDCDYCNKHICDKNGIIYFKNIRYTGTIELAGVIYGQAKRKNTYIILVKESDYEAKKHLFNNMDLAKHREIARKITLMPYEEITGEYQYDIFPFVSKEKFIKNLYK